MILTETFKRVRAFIESCLEQAPSLTVLGVLLLVVWIEDHFKYISVAAAAVMATYLILALLG